MKKAAILAAGEGRRLKEISQYKPIVKINGTPLLELTLSNLHFHEFTQVKIIFNEDEKKMNLKLLPSLNQRNIDYFFKSTASSMHSLYEVAKKLNLRRNEHFYVSMVDSIVKPIEAKSFIHFCSMLEEDESAIIATPYIDDETPLTLKMSHCGYVREFQCPIDDEVLVTSGVYCFSESIRPVLSEMIASGQTKMRTFLTELLKRHYRIKVFTVEKSLDIDRPSDVISAEAFLKESI